VNLTTCGHTDRRGQYATDQNLNPEIEIKSKPKRLVNISGFEKSLEGLFELIFFTICRVHQTHVLLLITPISSHVYRETEDSAGDFLHHKQLWLYQISLKRIEILLEFNLMFYHIISMYKHMDDLGTALCAKHMDNP
jgi:hypothetical protein